MQDILNCAMGLDVHRDTIVACLAKGNLGAEPEIEIRSFSTLIPEMQKLRDWVLETDCHHVAMESTGIYWQPIYEMLEVCFGGEINILVVNARHMKNVPGRKTDMRDAQWIATLLRAGLLKGSFIPDKAFRELRHLTRYRKSVVHDITAQKNRIDKFLQSSGFRFTAFLSDAFGASGQNIIRHLIQNGSIDREALDKCLKTKTRNRIDEILVALNGSLSMHQRGFLSMAFHHLEQLEAHRSEVEDAIATEILKHSEALNLLCSIPGIDVTAAASIIAEIGTDMSAFPDSQHICSWAGLSPGNNESAGKRKSAHINKGNPYLKSMLCEVGWIISGKRTLYLSGWYWRVKQRKGAKRATVAMARKLLTLIYTMLKTGEPYNEDCFEQRRKRSERKRANRMVNELQKLGYLVVAPE
ncbi:MAG: IS110 family transposase [Clostridiaceae bacterium]|nr:IS110 family transposase [Clostridiaceae bacterium]